MSLSLQRVVLECQSVQDYQTVVGTQSVDSSSWVTATLLHCEVRLGHELLLPFPSNGAAADVAAKSISFRVCDTIPWKSGTITGDTVVVIVPPLTPLDSDEQSSVASKPHDGVRFNTQGMEWVLVLLNHACDAASQVIASSALMSAIGGQCSAVVAVSDRIFFPIAKQGESHDDENPSCVGFRMYLRVPSSLFVGFMNLCSGSVALPCSAGTALRVPLDQFRCMMLSDVTLQKPNEVDALVRIPKMLTDAEKISDAVIAQKLLLVPALHDTVMQQWYGEHYAELFAEAIRRAAPALHLHCAYEDEVLMLPLPILANTPPGAPYTEVLASVELLAYTAKTRISSASVSNALFTRGGGSDVVPHHVIPCRVAIVGSKAMQGWGVMVTTGNSNITDIVMGASSTNPLSRDASLPLGSTVALRSFSCLNPMETSNALFGLSPIMSALSSSSLCCRIIAEFVSVRNRLLHALALKKSKTQFCHYITVIHGAPDNLPFEQALTACVIQGAFPLVIDCRAADVTESFLVKRLQALVLEPSPSVVLVRHAEILLSGDGGSELQQFLTSDIVGKGCPLYVLHVILISESTESSPNSKLSSLSTSSPLKAMVPNDREREAVAKALLSRGVSQKTFEVSRFVSCDTISEWTVGLSFSDVISFVQGSIVALLADLSRSGSASASLSVPILGEEHLQDFMKRFQKAQGHNLASTKLQPVRWSDVGGLEEAKREILETIQLPITHPELFAAGMKRRAGILLYGPPGCGKTLLAKAVATEMNINFISVKGPELINQYVGESERNVRNLFQRARDNAPCIVFFDELDALVPARGAKGDAGGAMDRIVAQLLVEVDGVSSSPADEEMDEVEMKKATKKGLAAKKDIFIIGATNRPDLLDPALLRPGRFDRLTYLGLPANKSEQLFAVRALTRKFSLAGDVNLEEIVAPLPFAFTGADFFALCSDAMMLAVDEVVAAAHARISERARLDQCGDDDDDDDDESANDVVLVRQQHFLNARSQLKPSVSADDLRKYEALKATFGQQSKQ